MKKYILSLLLAIGFISSCNNQPQISNDKIYFFFYDGCPYCHHAMEYINKKYPDLEMTKIDVYQAEGYKLFEACGDKFNLESIGTPLFCMGDKYIMGWSKNNERKFDRFVKPFIKNE